jgi:CBS domain-containing protein
MAKDDVRENERPSSAERQAPKEGAGMHLRHLMRPVREILHADQEIDEAVLRLSLQEIPILPVEDGDEIVGVLTHKHLAQASAAAPETDAKVTARVIMSGDFAFCYLDDDPATAHAMMDRHASDHLLVVDAEGGLVGILGREHLPRVSAARTHALKDWAEVVEEREDGGGFAKSVQPGGLDVYADRPRIRLPRD